MGLQPILRILWFTCICIVYTYRRIKICGRKSPFEFMKNTLRYNPPESWCPKKHKYNNHFFGLVIACDWVSKHLRATVPDYEEQSFKLLEIGSYKGESTSIFASSRIFDKIFCMDPFEGEEEALSLLGDNWDRVKKEYYTNTRHWDNINLIQDYSYNQVDNFPDEFFDVIYIDADHSYESVKKEIELYTPKCKYIIGGHDYHHLQGGVIPAVDEAFGKPDFISTDSSWFKILK